ncbi:MAG: FecR family protein [Treponema sp.]|jgi:hypothetical protein|nr:FecR family protein [Treponema sp.]
MKKLLVVMIMTGVAGAVWAQSPRAVIKELRGTVETKAPGSAAWQAATVGQELERETILSTGFKSEAVIGLGDSTLLARPLTRLTLGEIAAAAGSDRIEVQLRTGRIRADVKPPVGGVVDFTVRSPMATASVRGTSFEFDTLTLMVNEGTVAFSGADRTAVYVAAGQSSSPSAVSGRAALPVETAVAMAPPPPAGVEPEALAPPAGIAGVSQAPVTVGIVWD